MLRSFSTLGCPQATLEQALALAAAHGIDGIELRALAGRIDLPVYFSETYGAPERLAAVLRDSPVRVLAFGTSFTLARPGDADRAALLAWVPWAEATGVPWLRVFDGGVPGDLEALAETLRWWQGLRRAGGWRCDLIIETHDTLFAGREIAALARLVPGTRILWDSFNTWLKGGEDPLRTWAEIREHVVHLHVKDAVRRPSEKFSWTYVLPGEGEFPFRALLRQMEADGYAGHASLEWELLWHPYLAPLPAALESAKQAGWR